MAVKIFENTINAPSVTVPRLHNLKFLQETIITSFIQMFFPTNSGDLKRRTQLM